MGAALALALSGGGGDEEGDFAELPPPPGFTDTPAPRTETTPEEPTTARALFGHSCSACHTLRAAGSRAGVGPDLDELRPSASRVRATIRDGTPSGAMPPGLLVGREADRVARYVARVAGTR